MTYVVGAMVVMMMVETWCLWRVLDRLGAVGRLEERLASLTVTLSLLTDTTETCFQVIAGQLEQSPRPVAAVGRAARQRRMVGAVSRGRSVSEIAGDEEVAESEVHLRLYLAEQDAGPERGHDGPMLT
jgi:hypothetical protein